MIVPFEVPLFFFLLATDARRQSWLFFVGNKKRLGEDITEPFNV